MKKMVESSNKTSGIEATTFEKNKGCRLQDIVLSVFYELGIISIPKVILNSNQVSIESILSSRFGVETDCVLVLFS